MTNPNMGSNRVMDPRVEHGLTQAELADRNEHNDQCIYAMADSIIHRESSAGMLPVGRRKTNQSIQQTPTAPNAAATANAAVL